MDATREALLWGAIRRQEHLDIQTPRVLLNLLEGLGIIGSVKQGWATLDKWYDRDLYSFGVTSDLGWLELGAEFYRWDEVDTGRLMMLVGALEDAT